SGIRRSYISLVGGSLGAVERDHGVDMASITFLQMEDVDQIHYVSKRYATCGSYLYTHDVYGDMPVGDIVELVLEVLIDLSTLTMTVYHCRGGAAESDGTHAYPLLKELGKMLGGYLNQVPQLEWLLDYLDGKFSSEEVPVEFDREAWSGKAQL